MVTEIQGWTIRILNLRRKAGMGVVFIAIAVAGCLPAGCFGQISIMRSGSYEIGGFGGASYGVDHFRAMGGANVTYAINQWLLPYAEYTYLPGVSRTISQPVPGLSGTNAVSTFSTPFSDFHGGVHIRIPLRESPIVPYLVAGIGGLTHFQHARTLTYTGGDGLSHTIPGTDPQGTDLAFNFGGGVRYYLNERFGFRIEAKGYTTTNTSVTPVFGKVEIGIFYQLH
jgi:hypothetical protein